MKLERIQNYGMRIILLQPPRSSSEVLREKLKWMTLERRRKMARLVCVRKCVKREAPPCLNDRFRLNSKVGIWMTRNHTYKKLFVPRVYTEWFRKLKGILEWNRLPFEIVCSDSSSASFRAKLLILDNYFLF